MLKDRSNAPLDDAQYRLYEQCGFSLSNLKCHTESTEYHACSYELNGSKIEHRMSKITPTKTGQFVTIWKRNEQGITAPFDASQDIDFLIITSRRESQWGIFIFPKTLLIDKGIFSQDGKGGKRGIRVYPSWDSVSSKQAEKTQSWQTRYFIEIKNNDSSNIAQLKKIMSSIQ